MSRAIAWRRAAAEAKRTHAAYSLRAISGQYGWIPKMQDNKQATYSTVQYTYNLQRTN